MKKISIKFLSLILIMSILFTFVHSFFVKSEVNALSGSYTQYIKSGINAFPESYQKKLAYLKYLHPNWEFKAYYTGISWDELTSSQAENKCLTNTIHKGDLLDPSVLCVCGRTGDPGYYCASAKTVNYYLDPRNFMGEAMVFQFLDLSNGTGISKDIVAKTVSGTYLSPYVDDIMAAATEAGISPLHIVATIFQELGKSSTPPRNITGNVPGYEGLYNFYNYGATDGAGAVERGLKKARELGWTTPRYALVDGARRVLANEYISVGQTTKYFHKFDVVGNEILTEAAGNRTYPSSQFYGHQYMTNLRDPASQAGTLYDIYADNGILNEKLIFTIPVYNNMPASVPVPTSLSATPQYGLYYINSMKKWGISFRSSPGGSSLGNIYKDTVVLHLGNEGSWSKVKIIKTTGYNSSTRTWNSTEQIGYVSTEYLERVGADIPDYRDKVDMGNGAPPQLKAEIKIEGNNMLMTANTTKQHVLIKYPNAVVKWGDGSIVGGADTMLGTGGLVTIGNKTYTCIKKGDVNCDGFVRASDYVFIRNYLMSDGAIQLNDVRKKAGDLNKDGNVKASDYVIIRNFIMTGEEVSL